MIECTNVYQFLPEQPITVICLVDSRPGRSQAITMDAVVFHVSHSNVELQWQVAANPLTPSTHCVQYTGNTLP